MTDPPRVGIGPTRARDLLVVALVAAIVAYLLTRFNYHSLPTLPRLAGLTAALLGIGEAVAGVGLRRRIRAWQGRGLRDARDPGDIGANPADAFVARGAVRPRPVPPLLAAKLLAVAKASSLAAAALAGLWFGFGCYVVPSASQADAPAADSVTAAIGLVSALVLLLGALWLEFCCRAPRDADR